MHFLKLFSAVAVALKHAKTEEFQEYAQDVVANARTLCSALMDKGYTCVSCKLVLAPSHSLGPLKLFHIVPIPLSMHHSKE